MDFANLMTEIGKQFGIAPSTLLFYLFVITQAANITARRIPNNATGWLGTVRKIASIIGLYTSSRVAPGISVNDVAAAVTTPAIERKVAAASEDGK